MADLLVVFPLREPVTPVARLATPATTPAIARLECHNTSEAGEAASKYKHFQDV